MALRVLLLVEESYASRLRGLFEADGHAVEQARDGVGALVQAASTRPDVVVIDLDLTLADGYAVARQLRGGICRTARLVALSGRRSDAERQRMEAAGFAGFLFKPSDPAHLKRLVEQLTG